MWMFAALLILAAGLFPLQALVGLGAERIWWERSFAVRRRLGHVRHRLVHPWHPLASALVSTLVVVARDRLALRAENRRGVHADARRRDDARHAGHRSAGERHAGSGRSESPRRIDPRLSRRWSPSSAKPAGRIRRPIRPRSTWSRLSSTFGHANSGRSGSCATTTPPGRPRDVLGRPGGPRLTVAARECRRPRQPDQRRCSEGPGAV